MNSIKKFSAVALAIVGAVLLAPLMALFGLMMLGLAFGAALVAVAAAATVGKAGSEDGVIDGEAEPVSDDLDAEPNVA